MGKLSLKLSLILISAFVVLMPMVASALYCKCSGACASGFTTCTGTCEGPYTDATCTTKPTPATQPAQQNQGTATQDATTKKGFGQAMNLLDSSLKGTGVGKGTELSSLENTVALIVKGALSLVGSVFLILTIYAGILWMTARGREDKAEEAKNILKASIIGLFIVVSAYAITVFVTSRLGSKPASTTSKTELKDCTKLAIKNNFYA